MLNVKLVGLCCYFLMSFLFVICCCVLLGGGDDGFCGFRFVVLFRVENVYIVFLWF